jgi:hypothetical protein
METLESDALRRYSELKEYLSNPANLKVGADQPQKERRLKSEYQSKEEARLQKGLRLQKEFQSKKEFQPQKERKLKKEFQLKKELQSKKEFQLKNEFLSKKKLAKLRAERRLLKEEYLRQNKQMTTEFKRQSKDDNLRLTKQIAMERHRLKEEGLQLKLELETERRQLNEEFQQAKKQLKTDLQLQNDELQQLKSEFKRLKNSNQIKDFYIFKKKYSKLLEEQERWVSKFYDDFSRSELDSRWSEKQVISERLINGAPYSPIEDLHIFSPNNVHQHGGLLNIKTKQEKKQGLAWDKKYGFIPKIFSYTSGLLTSSHSFKQLYGKFEAKVQVKQSPGTYHAFWMGTDTQRPHLNIFKFEDHNIFVSAYNKDSKIERKLKYKLKDEFYIYTLLWTNNRLTWLINGKKVFETSNIINEPMYLSFSSGVHDKKADSTVMYVDWIRCFRSNM